MTIDDPDRSPSAHVAIAGGSGTETNFLVRYLAELGFDTELAHRGAPSTASDEDRGLPYVVRLPWLDRRILADDAMRLDAVLIAVRELGEMAVSRTLDELQAAHRAFPWMAELDPGRELWSSTPGGLMYSLNPLDQGRLLAAGFYQLLERLTRAEIPIFLLAYPRFLDEPRYLIRRLRPLLGSAVSEETLVAVHARINDAMQADLPGEPDAMQVAGAPFQAIAHPCGENTAHFSHAWLDQVAVRRELARMRRLQAETEAALESSRREIAEARLSGAGAREETRAVRAALERAGQTLRIETDRRDSEIGRRDGEIGQLREQLAAAIEQRDRGVAQLREEVVAANGERDREVAQLRGQVVAANSQRDSEVAQLNERLLQLREQVASARTDAERCRQKLEVVYSSRSWRLTHGFRAIGRVMQIVRTAGLRR